MRADRKPCGVCGTPRVKPHCIPCHSAAVRRWQEKNLDKCRAAATRWRKKNLPYKSRLAVEYAKRYPEKIAARNAARRALRKSRTAQWADNTKMLDFYRRARDLTKSTGVVHDVDHIVPLKSPLVCGLHVEENLQILPHKKNRSKSNLSWPDMP